MTVASLSTEATIRERLRKLSCVQNAFALFNGVVGRTRFFEAMSGKPGKNFSQHDAERLLEVIDEMEELASGDIPVDWARTDEVQTALVVRRVARIARELNIENVSLQQAAAHATQLVGFKSK